MLHGSQRVELGSGWKVPGAHSAQVDMRTASANVPGLHAAGAVAPVLHAEPTGQPAHCAAEAMPSEPLYVPAMHGSAAAAPSAQSEPAGHAKHAVSPLPSWKLPRAHLSQLPPEPKWPNTGIGVPPVTVGVQIC